MNSTPQHQKTNTLLIAGIPNVGKSTLLNRLANRKVAKTGNEPAITKGQQRIKLILDWTIIDSPGLLWPRLDDQDNAYKLACLGSIRNTAVDPIDLGWYLLQLLQQEYPQRLQQRYGIEVSDPTSEKLVEEIAAKCGTLGKQGRADLHRTATLLLNDFRSGKLGLFSLEEPPGHL